MHLIGDPHVAVPRNRPLAESPPRRPLAFRLCTKTGYGSTTYLKRGRA